LITYACLMYGQNRTRKAKKSKTHQVESIHVGFPHPFLHVISNLLWCTDGRGAETTDGDVFANGFLGPLGNFGRCPGPAFDGGPE